MSDRAWWPIFMADEVMPRPEASPTAWIREALGEKWLIAERQEDRCDAESTRWEIEPGETMDFMFTEPRPAILMRVNADGSYQLVCGTESGANHFFLEFEAECMADTLADLAGEAAELGETGLLTIICHYVSDEIPHRFEIGEDSPHFVALADVPEVLPQVELPLGDADLFDKEGSV